MGVVVCFQGLKVSSAEGRRRRVMLVEGGEVDEEEERSEGRLRLCSRKMVPDPDVEGLTG